MYVKYSCAQYLHSVSHRYLKTLEHLIALLNFQKPCARFLDFVFDISVLFVQPACLFYWVEVFLKIIYILFSSINCIISTNILFSHLKGDAIFHSFAATEILSGIKPLCFNPPLKTATLLVPTSIMPV